jgi:hypothetical protein
MDFFIDRNVPEKLARMLDHYDREHTVIYKDDRFEKTTLDTDWLTEIATWKPIPIVVSGDGRILKNPAELQVLRGLPLTVFLFASGWASLAWEEKAWKAVKVWPQVTKMAAGIRQPSVFEIPVSASKVIRKGHTANLGRSKRKR